MKKNLLSLLLLMLVCVQMAFAQAKVTGTVVDANFEPLTGASVQLKGASVAVATDIDGKFTINAKSGQTLVVSYVGFLTKEVEVPASLTLTVTLEENNQLLDEVVVVGVSMKKSDLTGSVSHIDSDVLTQKPTITLNDALAGRVAGVNVGKASSPSESSSIKIRGTNTINSGSAPIYVVDGLVMGDDYGFYNSLNVNDIESIQVLKDASATALYGSRGANGVILVTTKKGKYGKGEISYDGWVSFSKMGHKPDMMDANQIFDLRTQSFANGYMYNNPDGDREAYIQNVLWKSNIAFEDREFATHEAGKSYNWLNQFVHTGFQQNHNVAFSKATDQSNIYISLGVSDLDGIMRGTEQQRYSGRVNASANITSWLKVGTNSTYAYTHDDITDGNVYNQSLYNGNPLLDYSTFKDDATRKDTENLTLFWRAQSGETNNNFNPFNTLYEVKTDRSRYHLTSSNYINIRPIEGLDIRSTFAINRSEQKWNQFIPSGIQESIRLKSGDAYAKQQRDASTQWQWDNTVQFDRTFKSAHRVNAFAGYSVSRHISDGLSADGKRFASNDLGYNALFSTADKENISLYNYINTNSLMSFVARANYSYNFRYFVTVTGRWDGSSKFGDNHKWGFFPSFSLGWDITNESFFPKTWWANQVKLRGGYGVVGNQDIGDFMYATLYTPGFTDGKPSYNSTGRRGTPAITWEKQKQANIGVDLAFFNHRLTVNADVFFINNSNLLMSHNLPTTSGYTYTVENIGELQNRGFELTIGATPVSTGDFRWNINANLALDRNKINKLYGGVQSVLSGGRTGNWFVGESLSNIYTLLAGGIANEWNRSEWENIDFSGRTIGLGDLYALDPNGDNIVDLQNDRAVVGNLDPKFYGGFSTDFAWKGLALNAVFTYSYGGHALSGFYEGLVSSTGESIASTDLLDSWTPQNTGAFFPRRMRNANNYSAYGAGDTDRYLQSTSFLRLSTLSLSYTFPQRLLSKAHIGNLRAYFTASNVFTATKYKGFDPEYGDGNGYFPSERTYTIGLSFSIF